MNFMKHQSFGSADFQSRDRNLLGFIKNILSASLIYKWWQKFYVLGMSCPFNNLLRKKKFLCYCLYSSFISNSYEPDLFRESAKILHDMCSLIPEPLTVMSRFLLVNLKHTIHRNSIAVYMKWVTLINRFYLVNQKHLIIQNTTRTITGTLELPDSELLNFLLFSCVWQHAFIC